MPVQKVRLHRRLPNQYDELKIRLADEWRDRGSVDPRPNIREEMDLRGETVHIYVEWDDWGTLSQQERSEVIMDAYEEACGPAKALEVVVAMGVTPAEAKRMGLSRS